MCWGMLPISTVPKPHLVTRLAHNGLAVLRQSHPPDRPPVAADKIVRPAIDVNRALPRLTALNEETGRGNGMRSMEQRSGLVADGISLRLSVGHCPAHNRPVEECFNCQCDGYTEAYAGHASGGQAHFGQDKLQGAT